MSKSYEVQGLIHSLGETKEFGSNGFTKREFVLKLTGDEENSSYPNYIALELIKDKCAMIDAYSIGDEITVHLNLSGRLWSSAGQPERCFTSLQAWRIERAGAGAGMDAGMNSFDQSPPPPPMGDDNYDDVPF